MFLYLRLFGGWRFSKSQTVHQELALCTESIVVPGPNRRGTWTWPCFLKSPQAAASIFTMQTQRGT